MCLFEPPCGLEVVVTYAMELGMVCGAYVMQERTRERLFEEEMEVVWEKGGSGLVFYTDASFWKEQEGGVASKLPHSSYPMNTFMVSGLLCRM